MSINQDIHSSVVSVTDTGRQEAISNLIQELVKEKKDPDLDLRIDNEEAFEKIIPFKKKNTSDAPPTYLLQYNHKNTRGSLILQLDASPRKIWVWLRRHQS